MGRLEPLPAKRRQIQAKEHAKARDMQRRAIVGGIVEKMIQCGELSEAWLKIAIEKYADETDKKLFSENHEENYAVTLAAMQELREGKGTVTSIEELAAIAKAEASCAA